jgi:RNA polymerase sigma-70 factor (sigma-E family)
MALPSTLASAVGRPAGPPGMRPVTSTLSGDDGFREVYAAQFDLMIRLAYLTTGSVSAAEDVVQDAFIDLYRHWSTVREPVAWLRRAVVNRSTSWLRRVIRERRHASPPPTDDVPPHPFAEVAAVRAALATLRPRHRAALFLRYYLDLSDDDIAAALDCRPATVRSLIHRGLAALREIVDVH